MEKPFNIFLTLIFIFGASFLGLSQKKITSKDQKEIRKVCDVYLRHRSMVFADSTASTDSLFSVISEPVKQILNTYRKYLYSNNEFEIEFPVPSIIDLHFEDSVGCQVKVEDYKYFINTEKINGNWKVIGFNNETSDESDVENMKTSVAKWIEQDRQLDSIKQIMRHFVSAWSEFRQFGDSTDLRQVCSEEFYTYLSLSREFDTLRGIKKGAVSLREITYAQRNPDSDTIWCRAAIKGEGGSRFPFLKINGTWRVSGVDNRVCTSKEIADIKERIALYHEKKQFNSYLETFNKNIEVFLKRGDRKGLDEITTEDFMLQLEVYRHMFGTYDTNQLEIYGVRKPVIVETQIEIYGDTAYYNNWMDSIRWIKKEGNWLFDELISSADGLSLADQANTTFRTFVDIASLNYSKFNLLDENDQLSVPPVIAAGSYQEDYTETKYYHHLDDSRKEIVYATGKDQLLKDLRLHTEKASDQTTFKGIVFVEFEVDNLGKAQNFKVLTQLSEPDTALALEIMNELGSWLPNNNPQSSLTKMVLALEFD